MKAFWDARYAALDFAYGKAPNVFFANQLAQLPNKGKILLPMDGEGRNAVYAATQGWDVTAFDFSPTAVAKTHQLATEKGVQINCIAADAALFDYGSGQYDAVALIFAHLPEPVRTHMHRACVTSLKPGGLLLAEGFHHLQLNHPSGGPQHESLLFTTQTLATDFAGLDVHLNEDLTTQLNEGLFHVGSAHVVRFVGTKPK